MSLTLPSNATRANCDAGTDDPKQAILADLYNSIGFGNELKAALGNLALLQYGNGFSVESQSAGTADKLHAAIATLTKTALYTVLAADRGKLIDCTSGTFSLTFTAAATLGDGWFCYVRNSGSGIITLDPNSTELIDGASTITLAAGESCAVQCTGTALKSIGKTVSGGGISGETTYNTNTTLSLSTDHTKLIRCTVASVVYTFPAATSNEGKYWWIQNATSTDTGVRLVCDGAESIGGATGATIYIPAYTTIGFVSDGTNWIVFQYSGKREWSFTASGTLYAPPWLATSIPTLIDAIGGGGGAWVSGFTATSGGATSLGALLSVNGAPGANAATNYVDGTLGGAAGSHRAGVASEYSGNAFWSGAHPRFASPHIADTTTLYQTGTGYGIGGITSRVSADWAGVMGSGAWCIAAPVTMVPGTPYTVTIGAAGANEGGGTFNAAPTAGYLLARI